MDSEKVIKGLELCEIGSGDRCYETECPYYEQGCTESLKNDILELLKEREAVEPKTGHWIWVQYCANEGVYCSECHTKMFDYYPMKKKLSQFCGHCGAKMGDEVGVR